MAILDDLQRRWYQDRPPPWWMRPLAILYGGISGLRRALYRRAWLRTTRLPMAVIVVGNIVAGGTGKTPLVIALAEGLRARGFKPGVVSRGYGGAAREPMLLSGQPDAAVVGDEPALIRSRTGVPVAIGARRAEAATLLIDQGVDVIVADDGLQHYALARDVEICVVDGVRRFGNGRLLPAGPLREPLTRLRSIDFIVCNGGEPLANEIPMRLRMEDAHHLMDGSTRPLSTFAGQRVHAVAGIGNPGRFFAALRDLGLDVIEHAYPDHHHYHADDLVFGDDLPVLMTEKDSVKCRGFAGTSWWTVPVSAALPSGFIDDLVARLPGRSPLPAGT